MRKDGARITILFALIFLGFRCYSVMGTVDQLRENFQIDAHCCVDFSEMMMMSKQSVKHHESHNPPTFLNS